MEGEGEQHLRITCIGGLPLSVATENGGYKMESEKGQICLYTINERVIN